MPASAVLTVAPFCPTMTANIDQFIARWQASGAAERANYQLFLSELCDVLDVPRPDPSTPDDAANAYVFEKCVPLPQGTSGRIDLYRRGCFVLEAKQGSDAAAAAAALHALSAEGQARARSRKRGTAPRGTAAWDTAMEKARQQAQHYARNLPPNELAEGGRPPFLVVVDVGECLTLHSEFTRTGGNYIPFPDPPAARISLPELADPARRDLLRSLWFDPMSLDPSRRAARVTRDIADRLARLAKALEQDYAPDAVAHFLMRCLFTMFSEDVGLLPAASFTELLAASRRNVAHFPRLAGELWSAMATGGFSVALRQDIRHFDGGLFEDATVLPLTADQLQLLIEAAQADWRDVEPAIFGTLLEHALDTVERHHLGAHFTPRAYVERLVAPTIVEPLRAEWEAVQAAALRLNDDGKPDKALAEVEAFQKRLASIKILDPACGTGNFLYVSLEHLLRLEAEVLQRRRELGKDQMLLELEAVRVTPRQMLGIEINPRAAAIAELVLWIGYLRWRLQTAGNGASVPEAMHLPEPLLGNYHTIERRDAVLAWDAVEPLLDKDGRPVTRWDGRTTKPHPVTGEQVPDETARIPAYRYVNPRPAEWPAADFVVGNPPFIGTSAMRASLGDGYAEAIRKTYKDVPESADYVMYWWDKAAELVRQGAITRFGFITTNSIRQTFNRKVLQRHMDATPPLSVVFAIPDHPWVDTAEGADVRIAVTAAVQGQVLGTRVRVVRELGESGGEVQVELIAQRGTIQADLTVGAGVSGAKPLRSNSGISGRGVQLFGAGFIVDREEAEALGLGTTAGLEKHIRPYRNGRDIAARPRNVLVIDLFGLTTEEVRSKYPIVYQWLHDRVKPERDQNNRASYRLNWWIHGEPRSTLRASLKGLARYITTIETARRRYFVFLPQDILPDNMLVNIAIDDGYCLGILSSRAHVSWALAVGGRLGIGNDPRYNKTRCFETFPFPDPTDAKKARIRALAEELDAHRKRQQAQHPKLTLTDMYNVLEKLRAGEPLTKAEKVTHEQGLVSVLRQLHDEIDAAVFDVYGWPSPLTDEEILARLVALNAERAAEEARGLVRWLRPEYQAPSAAAPGAAAPPQAAPEPEEEAEAERAPTAPAAALRPWPAGLAEQAAAVRAALTELGRPATAEEVAATFAAAPSARIAEWLAALAALGQARAGEDGRFVAG